MATESIEKEVTDTASAVPFVDVDASKIKFPGEQGSAGAQDDDDEDPLKGVNNSGDEDDEEEGADDGKKGPIIKTGKEEEGNDYDGPVTFNTLEEYETGVNSLIEKLTEGSVKDVHSLRDVYEENLRLKEQLESATGEPQFPNEKAKILYDYANKAANFETQAMGQYLHVLTLGDVNKLEDKQAQFEAFHLTRPDLSREKAKALFEADYEDRYNNLEDSILQQDKHAIATREAKEKLSKMVDEFGNAREDSQVDPKVTEAIHKSIEDAFNGFAGIKIPFGEKDEDALSVNLNKEEASEFRQVLKEPIRLIEKIIESCTENGKLNEDAYISEMYALFAGKRLTEEAIKHGQTLGQVGFIKERRNVQGKGNAGTEAKGGKKSFEETLLGAVLAKRS